MQLATRNETPRKAPPGIRDTSATDVRLAPTTNRKRFLWVGGIGIAALLAAAVLYPLLMRWTQAEVSVPLDRVRTAVVTRGDFVRDVRRDIERAAARSIIDALAGGRPSGAVNDPRPDRHAEPAARQDLPRGR